MHHRDARHGDGAGKTVWPMEVKENIEVLICTVDEGIRRVPDVLSPTVRGVSAIWCLSSIRTRSGWRLFPKC